MSVKFVKSVVLVAAVSALIGAVMQSSSLAQYGPYAPRYRHVPPRIEITPRPLLYRRCVERLELQYRPSGPVLYPLTYCWWVRG
jgi:hypothetical protein